MFLDRNFRSDGHRTRTAAVTGTRVAIGTEEARTFAQGGWTLCAADVDDTARAALQEEFALTPTPTLDVTDEEDASSRRSARDPPSHG